MNLIRFPDAKTLTGGFYSLDEAARLLKIENKSKLRSWLRGYDKGAPPVLIRQYPDSASELGFYDLMEIRFIDYFRRQNISLQSLRKAADAARRELKQRHPFALSNVKFLTDRKRIFMQVAEETKDTNLSDIVSGQYAMYDMIEESLAKGVEFHPGEGLASHWRPDPKNFPNVIVDPKRAHGQPVIDSNNVPTSALFSLWRAEGQDFEAVQDWFATSKDLVQQAIEFEIDLAA